jgi:Holliday junction resolvase RusA-like endonuclease
MSEQSDDVVRVVLLGQPRGKERVRVTQVGHVYTPERTVTYEGRLAYAAQQAMGERPPLEGPLWLDMIVKLPVAQSWPKAKREAALAGRLRPTKKPDFDNYAKTIDAFNLIVWLDDAQVIDGRVRKFYSDKPGIWIEVRPVRAEGVFG